MKWYLQQGIALFLSWCLLLVGVGDGFAYQADPSSQPAQAAQQSPEQLQQLIAPIRDCSWTARESVSGWDSELGCLAASAGVGRIRDSIGTTAGESSSTTTRTSRIAGRIVNRNSFHAGRTNFDHGAGRSLGGHEGFQGPTAGHAPTGTHSGAFSGFSHGGITRGNAFRGQSSFGGFHGGGGGGFHGGGHGGGWR